MKKLALTLALYTGCSVLLVSLGFTIFIVLYAYRDDTFSRASLIALVGGGSLALLWRFVAKQNWLYVMLAYPAAFALSSLAAMYLFGQFGYPLLGNADAPTGALIYLLKVAGIVGACTAALAAIFEVMAYCGHILKKQFVEG